MDIPVREKILCEANKVISEKGLNSFTLEEVARRAGVSKGGLLYHFPNKDRLIQGLIEYYIEKFEEKIMDENSKTEPKPCNWLAAFIDGQFCQAMAGSNTMAGFLAAVALNQELLQPVRDKRRERFDMINSLEDPVMGMIISFACEGIAFSKLFGLETFPSDIMQKIQDRLIDLSKEC